MPDPLEVSSTSGTLLGLLSERAMTGWELVAEAKNRVGNFWTIQRSQAYRELAQLQKAGLVIALPEEERRKPAVPDHRRRSGGLPRVGSARARR